jgi:hypothetical protein
MKTILTLIAFLLVSFSSMAQDTLYKRNGEKLVVKIKEIGLDEVKYKLIGYEDGPMISIAKDNLIKVAYANGDVQLMLKDMENPENYAGQKKNAIKVDFISPLRDNLSFIYERSIRPGRSIEFNLGIVGVGIGTRAWDESSGAFFRVGYKFIKTPDYYLRGMKYSHILKGGYVRPDFILGTYSIKRTIDNSYYNPLPPYNYITNITKTTRDVTYGALHVTLGKQWVYDDAFLVDFFCGVGYAVSNMQSDDPDNIYTIAYGVTGGGSETPFSASAGFRVGFLFK